MAYPIKKLTLLDEGLIRQASDLLKQVADRDLSCYFIENSPENLKSLIGSDTDHIYFSTEAETGDIFCLLHVEATDKIAGDHELIIRNDWWQPGISSLTLTDFLTQILRNHDGYETICVEIFEKNAHRLNTYLAIGMAIVNYKNWYELTTFCNNAPGSVLYGTYAAWFNTGVKVIANTLYYNNKKVASVVNHAHLLVYIDSDIVISGIAQFYKHRGMQSACLQSKRMLKFLLIDKSFSLQLNANKLRAGQ